MGDAVMQSSIPFIELAEVLQRALVTEDVWII
jgi:hypothetical protein